MNNFARYDDDLDDPLLEVVLTLDVPSAVDPEGITSDAAGNLYVVDGALGGLQVLTYDSNLNFVSTFSVAAQMADAEGIAYHEPSGHLFVVDSVAEFLFEYTTTGVFVEQYDLDPLVPEPDSPQGLTFAPPSNPSNYTPGTLALYIADGGDDQILDGYVYEAVLGQPPSVHAGLDQVVSVPLPSVAQLDGTVSDPDTPLVTTTWSQISGPGTVTFGNVNAVDTTASFPAVGDYELQLTADDGTFLIRDQVMVTVTDDEIVTLDIRIDAASDDAEERPIGTVVLNSSDLEFVFEAGTDNTVGMRFNNVFIPSDATLVDAYVQFQVDEVNLNPNVALTIQGQAIDDAPTFTVTPGDITSRQLTTASVPWTPPPWPTEGEAGADQRTPDITPLLQEIIDRPGWSNGNSLALIVNGTGQRTAESFNGDPTAALFCTWSTSKRTSHPCCRQSGIKLLQREAC